ncbi:MAG: hypothetical protein ISS47_01865 [Candidatus Omnitrophica bacterium]|nr:hypothetical protein [Candidatus Omnitrophota bacterium]
MVALFATDINLLLTYFNLLLTSINQYLKILFSGSKVKLGIQVVLISSSTIHRYL